VGLGADQTLNASVPVGGTVTSHPRADAADPVV
jgi:hypothetical protein